MPSELTESHQGVLEVGRARVTLTFDDGLDSHLDRVIPMLDERGLVGTFFTHVGSDNFAKRSRQWAEAARKGHELGNHTIFHPGISTKSWVTPGLALEQYSLDRMQRELVVANQILSMVDGESHRSFAYPCGNCWLGTPPVAIRVLRRMGLENTRLKTFAERLGFSIRSGSLDYSQIVRSMFVGARIGSINPSQLSPMPADWYRVPAIVGDGARHDELWRAVSLAKELGAWVTFVFHDIGTRGQLSVDTDDFARFLDWVASDPNVKTYTFREVCLGRPDAVGLSK
jgi:peptidoglycan/xylan/chitin deacetylase (PgdA/CDA1 family)